MATVSLDAAHAALWARVRELLPEYERNDPPQAARDIAQRLRDEGLLDEGPIERMAARRALQAWKDTVAVGFVMDWRTFSMQRDPFAWERYHEEVAKAAHRNGSEQWADYWARHRDRSEPKVWLDISTNSSGQITPSKDSCVLKSRSTAVRVREPLDPGVAHRLGRTHDTNTVIVVHEDVVCRAIERLIKIKRMH
jgi:hypothetical protein